MRGFDPSAPVIIEPVTVVRDDTFRAETVIDQIVKMDRRHAVDQFERGDLFAEFVDGDYQHADHCQTLAEFLKKHDISLSTSTIKDVKNARYAKKLNLDRGALLRAGGRKVTEIFKLDPDATFVDGATKEETKMADVMVDLIQRATEMSPAEIKAVVKQFQSDEIHDDDIVKETVHYTVLQKEVVDLAVERMTKFSGTQKDPVTGEDKPIGRGTAYERIMANFLADPNFEVEEHEAGIFLDQVADRTTELDATGFEINGVRYIRDDEGNAYEVAD